MYVLFSTKGIGSFIPVERPYTVPAPIHLELS